MHAQPKTLDVLPHAPIFNRSHALARHVIRRAQRCARLDYQFATQSKRFFVVITTMYVKWSAESQEVVILARKVVHGNRPVVHCLLLGKYKYKGLSVVAVYIVVLMACGSIH